VPNDDDVTDPSTAWVAKHVQRYVASDGAKGHQFYGAPSLLLTTRGRRSGKLRRTALYYGVHPEDPGPAVDTDADPDGRGRAGARYVLVASNGGAKDHPLWYLNILADPRVHLQVGADHYDGRARPATAEELPRLWELMIGVWPSYAGYRKKTRREIPVVVVDVDG
jgi:deazaflavin-dependent oxidoreductase (nitroreductase family)